MLTTPRQFAELVDLDYGSEICTQFLQKFQNPDDKVGFAKAMVILDEILKGQKPIFPHFGPTGPCNHSGHLIWAEDVEAQVNPGGDKI